MSICIFILLKLLWLLSSIHCHIPQYVSTPPNKLDQFCVLAETCVHDTIPVCGKMEDEVRSFLDICDMLEYVCDTNEIYQHVDDQPGCPVAREKY